MTQRELLMQLIKDNKNTEYGKKYNFKDISTIEDYQKSVPLVSYKELSPYIAKMEQGADGILTAYPVDCMLTTSGSSGKQKHIPLTEKALQQYSGLACQPLLDLAPPEGAHFIHTSVFREEPGKKEKMKLLSVAHFGWMRDHGYFRPENYVGGEKLLFSKQIKDSLFVKAWSGLSDEGLIAIHSIFLYDVLMLFWYIEQHWQMLISCMESRHIPDEIEISEGVRRLLLGSLLPDSERICMLKKAFGEGFSGIAKRIWPRLKLVNGIGGAFFQTRERVLRSYIEGIPIFYFAYAASECYMGNAAGLEKKQYVLLPDCGFYEFEDQDTGEVRHCGNVEAGRVYEMIVTNFSGLYRYRMADIVRVTDFKDGMPEIEILYRKNQSMNIAGEKMSFAVMEEAVCRFSGEHQIKIYDYSVIADKDHLPGRYLLLLESDTAFSGAGLEELSGELDMLLGEVNEDYKDLRGLGALDRVKIVPLKMGAHMRFKKQKNGASSQNKPAQMFAMGDFDYKKEMDV